MKFKWVLSSFLVLGFCFLKSSAVLSCETRCVSPQEAEKFFYNFSFGVKNLRNDDFDQGHSGIKITLCRNYFVLKKQDIHKFPNLLMYFVPPITSESAKDEFRPQMFSELDNTNIMSVIYGSKSYTEKFYYDVLLKNKFCKETRFESVGCRVISDSRGRKFYFYDKDIKLRPLV